MRRFRDEDQFRQKKSLGQVFLSTEWPVVRMVERLKELRIERALEIGPGNGILTRALIGAGLRVTAVEKDDRFAGRMAEYADALEASKTLEVVNADILKYDWQGWIDSGSGRAAVVGNIPYNISSPIVLRGLDHIRSLTAMMFMTQLEFAARVVARPNTKDFGSLSVFAQLRADVTLEFKVSRSCFQPMPKVDSAVMTLLPKREAMPDDILRKAEQVTRAAFMQRRKKLRNSVRQFFETSGVSEDGSPIELDRRADSLSPREFVLLAQYLVP